MAAFAKSWRRELNKAPGVPGLGVLTREKNLERPDEALDTLILSQGTNQARRRFA